MSEKDIKVKPQTTTKSVKNAPKSVEHSAKTAAWDIKTVAKDTLVKNAIDKQLDIKHSEQPQRAEVEATEQVENTYYSAVDTVYQKGKSLAENKVKQHRQQVKTKKNTNVPQNKTVSDIPNTPKQAEHTPKTKESVQASAPENAPEVQSKSTAQVKTKEAYMKSQKTDISEKSADTVKTKANYIKQHKTAEVKDGVKPKTDRVCTENKRKYRRSLCSHFKNQRASHKGRTEKICFEKTENKS